MSIKCLVIDDEPLARETMEDYVGRIPALELAGTCRHVFEALDLLQQDDIPLLFSDINMPEMNGIEFIRSLPNPPYVIFTTAYPNYAVEGFEVDALDYIVKPFSFQRFLKAVNKALDAIQSRQNVSPAANPMKPDYLFVKDGHRLKRVRFAEVVYVEGLKDYVKLVLEDHTVVTHLTMRKVEEIFPSHDFVRTHRSYIVRSERIKSLDGNSVSLYGRQEEIPVGKTYREQLHQHLGLDGE